MFLKAHEIVSRNIPACTPQHNGSVECGGKEFKKLFYNVWERLERNGTDKEKSIDARVQRAVAKTVHLGCDQAGCSGRAHKHKGGAHQARLFRNATFAKDR